MTLYPVSKCTPERAVDMVEMYGADRLLVNQRRRLGAVKADGRAGLYSGDAESRACRGADSQGGV